MKKFTTADRLKEIMTKKKIKQVDILEACKPFCEKYNVKLQKNDLSQYVSGKVEPKQDKLTILGLALNVNEVWLMGYNIPSDRDALEQIEKQIENNTPNCELFEHCHDKEAIQAVKLFVQLDTLDKGRVIGSMETMLQSDKYSNQELKRMA